MMGPIVVVLIHGNAKLWHVKKSVGTEAESFDLTALTFDRFTYQDCTRNTATRATPV
jgi:hypothetical protein